MFGSLTASRETCKKVKLNSEKKIIKKLKIFWLGFIVQGDQRGFFDIYGAPFVFEINDLFFFNEIFREGNKK